MAEGPLQGKVAIITGAASPIGLGHAMTVGLVRAGARVALLKPAPQPRGRNWDGKLFFRDDEIGSQNNHVWERAGLQITVALIPRGTTCASRAGILQTPSHCDGRGHVSL
jgi:NAD(P)-dependent dehydrogenase (short-subunit alcohol dehydrogenase family)